MRANQKLIRRNAKLARLEKKRKAIVQRGRLKFGEAARDAINEKMRTGNEEDTCK